MVIMLREYVNVLVIENRGPMSDEVCGNAQYADLLLDSGVVMSFCSVMLGQE